MAVKKRIWPTVVRFSRSARPINSMLYQQFSAMLITAGIAFSSKSIGDESRSLLSPYDKQTDIMVRTNIPCDWSCCYL